MLLLRALRLFGLPLFLASVSALRAQIVTEPDLPEKPRIEIEPAVENGLRLTWFGREGFSYFLQTTTDLVTEPWQYLPVIETGHDDVIAYGLVSTSPRFFTRIVLTEQTSFDPMTADFDGDGLTNDVEFANQTDPLSPDTDRDGLSDAWEINHGLPANNAANALADTDGDGTSDLAEYVQGTDPQAPDPAVGVSIVLGGLSHPEDSQIVHVGATGTAWVRDGSTYRVWRAGVLSAPLFDVPSPPPPPVNTASTTKSYTYTEAYWANRHGWAVHNARARDHIYDNGEPGDIWDDVETDWQLDDITVFSPLTSSVSEIPLPTFTGDTLYDGYLYLQHYSNRIARVHGLDDNGVLWAELALTASTYDGGAGPAHALNYGLYKINLLTGQAPELTDYKPYGFLGVSRTGVALGQLADQSYDKYSVNGVAVDYHPYFAGDTGVVWGGAYESGIGFVRRAYFPDGSSVLSPPEFNGFFSTAEATRFDPWNRLHGTYWGEQSVWDLAPDPADPEGDPVWTRSPYQTLILGNGLWTDHRVPPGLWEPQGGTAWWWDAATQRTMSAPTLFVPGRLAVDADHDGEIVLPGRDDPDATYPGQPFRFWSNDDNDSGDTNGNDIPIVATTNNGPANWQGDGGTYLGTHGTRDLIDWFPVYLDIKQLLAVLPPSANAVYKLKQEDGALNFVYTGLTRATATDYQKEDKGLIFGPTLTQKAGQAEKRWMIAAGVDIFGGSTGSAEFLDAIKNHDGGVILVEGRKATTKPLVLSVEKSDGTVIAEVKLEIKISSVEDMYRRLNFRDSNGEPPPGLLGDLARRDNDLGLPTSMGEPTNFPDSQTNGKWFVMVVGSNVGGQKMRGWQSEVFKRMWWSKSKARFVGVSWYGDPYSDGNDLVYDYHSAARNAFATAPALANALNALSGSKTVAGHSAAALIISSAVADHGLNAVNTCLLDAAMARECFDGSSADDLVGMVPEVWRDYPAALWSARWSERFGATDARSGLTWRNRFSGATSLSTVHNFYSSTEEVLGRYEGTVNGSIIENLRAPGSFAWVIQEKAKGDKLRILGLIHAGSDYGGWGFNLHDPITGNLPKWYLPNNNAQRVTKIPEQIGSVTTQMLSDIKIQPLFKTGWGRYYYGNPAVELVDTDTAQNTGPSWILDLYGVTAGNTIAADPMKRTQLLNEAIPATSLAVGANPLAFSTLPNTRQYNMPAQFADPAHWPSARGVDNTSGVAVPNWHHSDMREVAYIYLYQFFDKLASLSNQ